MPDFNSLQEANRVLNRASVANETNALVKSELFEFVAPAGVVEGDRVLLGRVPHGARILPQSKVHHSALGTGVTIGIGYEAFIDIAGVTVAAAPAGVLAVAAAATAGSRFFDLAGTSKINFSGRPVPLWLTFAGGDVATDGTVRVYLQYTNLN